MAEAANNTNLALETFAILNAIVKLGRAEAIKYGAAARRYALAGPTASNAAYWNALAGVLEQQTASTAALSALKQSALSVSDATAAALRAWQPGIDAKVATAKQKIPVWVWLAATAGVLYAVGAR